MTDLFRPSWREGRGPIPRYIVRPTVRFMRVEAAGGIVIVTAALVALIWANVAPGSYEDFWFTEIVLNFDILTLDETLEGWVNDALMTIFFFVVALEIKREAVHGDLRDPRQAALPVLAALGGMVVPALIFTAFNAGGEGSRGWGIPVATDIAFALGVLALVGNRIPVALKVFLLTLAVADDIGGIVIIAIFYTDDLSFSWLGAAFGFGALILVMQRSGFRSTAAYMVAGGALWLCVFESGVAATIAGVVLGLMTPAAALYERGRFTRAVRSFLQALDRSEQLPDHQQQEDVSEEALRGMEHLSVEARSPLERLEDAVAPWSAFLIVPIFALANAGINLGGGKLSDAVESDVAWGVAVGLVLGKVGGVTLFTYLTVRFGVASLPADVRWSQICGVALLSGIGFTVAIFIAGLSFDELELVENAKIGIFAASIIAAILGFFLLRLMTPRRQVTEAMPAPAG